MDNLSRALAVLGHDITVLTQSYDGAPPGTATAQGVRVCRVSLSRSLWASRAVALKEMVLYRRSLEIARKRSSLLGLPLRRLHEEEPFDIIHAHDYFHTIESLWVPDAPAIFTNHTSMFISDLARGKRATIWRAIRHFDRFIAPSVELADLTIRTGAAPQKVAAISNGVDACEFAPVDQSEFRTELGWSCDHFVVLTARRLVEKNGVDYLVRAMPKVVRQVPEARLLIAGDGPQRSELEELVDALDVADAVRFLGNVPRRDIPRVTNSSDVAVLPSLKEATSIAGLEAMACGKPLVGTQVGGIPEIIADGETGLLVPPEDPDALADAIVRLGLRPDERREMAKNARARVEAEFSWPMIANRTLEIYRQAVHAHDH